MLVMNFILVKGLTAYNAIFDQGLRSWMKAVPSTFHQKMKFPTRNGVGEMQSDQTMTRKCYVISTKFTKPEIETRGKEVTEEKAMKTLAVREREKNQNFVGFDPATGGSFRRSTATGGEFERWGKLLQRRVAVYINLEPGARRSWRLLGTAQGELPQPFRSPWRFFQRQHMASRGRRGGVPAREGEQRREEQTEQQAPAPQGPMLPPPPPVDYGVFMQGLVQAMQTQTHTQAALQAQLEAQAQAQVPVPQAQDHGGPSIMERFKRMLPP
ncbi:hypothetical protein Taro_037032, partial [Colocasia esculenta]|nr:hypothetical protein [Colocasia esculenta]